MFVQHSCLKGFLKFFQAETQEPSTPQTSSVPSDREEINNDVLSPPNIPNVFSGEFYVNIAVEIQYIM